MFKRRVLGAGAVWVLAFAALVAQCKAGPISEQNALLRLQEWIDRVLKPEAVLNDVLNIENYVGILSKMAETINSGSSTEGPLNDPQIRELVEAISELSLTDICSHKNSIAADKVRHLILGERSLIEEMPELEYPLVRAVYDYLHRIESCRLSTEATWNPEHLSKIFDISASDPIDKMNEYDHRGQPHVIRFRLALQRQFNLEARSSPFSPLDILVAMFKARSILGPQHFKFDENERGTLEAEEARDYMNEHLVEPCKVLVSDTVNRDFLEQVVLLGPFLNLDDQSSRVTAKNSIEWASRYLTCKVLLTINSMDENWLNNLALGTAKEQEYQAYHVPEMINLDSARILGSSRS